MSKRIQYDKQGNRIRTTNGTPYWSRLETAKMVKRVHNPQLVPAPRIRFDPPKVSGGAPIPVVANQRRITRAIIKLKLSGHTHNERVLAYNKAGVA